MWYASDRESSRDLRREFRKTALTSGRRGGDPAKAALPALPRFGERGVDASDSDPTIRPQWRSAGTVRFAVS